MIPDNLSKYFKNKTKRVPIFLQITSKISPKFFQLTPEIRQSDTRDSFKLLQKQYTETSSSFLQITSKTKHNERSIFFQTTSKIKHKESPRFFPNMYLKKKQKSSPRSFQTTSKTRQVIPEDYFEVLQKQNKKGLRNSFKVPTSKIRHLRFFQTPSKIKHMGSPRFFQITSKTRQMMTSILSKYLLQKQNK